MDHRHDDTDRDEGMVYVGRFGDAELTEDDRDTLQAAFAALARSGRPLFGPVPEDGAGALIDPADPGLNTRVSAILDGRPSLVLDEHGSMGPIGGFDAPRPLSPRREEVDDAEEDGDDGDELALLDELDQLDPELDIAEIDALMVPDHEAEDDAGDAGGTSHDPRLP